MNYKLDDFDLLIDDVLLEVSERGGSIEIFNWLNQYPGAFKIDDIQDTIERIVETGLFTREEGIEREIFLKKTAKGREVERYGGWIAQVDNSAFERRMEKVDSEVNRKKAKYELRLARWQTWFFWPIAIFGLIGGVHALLQILDLID